MPTGTVVINIEANDKTGGAFSSAFSNIQGLGSLAAGAIVSGTAAAGTAIAGLAAKGIIEFTSFQESMNEVFTLLPGISEQAMGEMSSQVLSFSEDMGRLPDETIPALYQALSAGVPADNVFSFLETAHESATAGVTDLETAVDGITSVMNAYGPEVVSATSASDLMFTAVKLGKTNFEELSTSLSNVTPIAAGMGVSFGDVTAALAAMTSQGTPTAQATVQMRALLQELGTAGTDAAGIFEDMAGTTFLDFIDSGGNVAEALQIMEQAAAETGTPIQDMFGNVRAGLGALQLTGDGMDTFVDNIDAMANSAGATDEAYGTMSTSIQRTFEQLKATAQTTFIRIGEALAPFVAMLSEGLLEAVNQLMPKFEIFLGFITQAITQFQNGVDPLTILKGLIMNIAGLLGIQGEKWNELNATLNSIHVFILQFIETAIEFKNQLMTALQPVIDWISNTVTWKDLLISLGIIIASVVIPAIISIASTIIPIIAVIVAIIAIVTALRTAWETNFLGIRDIVTQVIETVKVIITTALNFIKTFWAANGNEIKGNVSTTFNTIKNTIQNIISAAETIITAVLTRIQDFWAAHGDSVVAVVIGFLEMVRNNIQTKIDAAQAIIETVLTAIEIFWDAHGQKIMDAVELYINYVKDIIDTVLDTIGQIFDAFAAAFEGDWVTFGQELRDAWDTMWTGITTALGDFVSGIIQIIVQFVLDIIAQFENTDWGAVGTSIIQGIADGISAGAQVIADAAMAAAQAALDAAKGFLGIESPSKVFRQVGIHAAEGFAIGMLSQKMDIAKAVHSSLSPAVDFATDAFSHSASYAASGSRPMATNVQNFTYNVRANYEDVQSPGDIALTLRLIQLLKGVDV